MLSLNLAHVYRYSEYDLQAYATLVSNRSSWIAEKVDSNTQQTIATRAFKASERVLFGRAKKVRYKVPSPFRSMEGKSNKQGIRWKNNQLVWCGLTIKAIIDNSNPVIMHGLTSVVKYVRILWRELNGKRRWYAQLVGKGLPYQKPQNSVKQGTVGLDINLHNVAFVADNHADLLPFANKVPNCQREIAKLQRQMERSRRANNPNNYESDASGKKGRKIVTKKGKPKKGKRKWNNSKTYLRTATKKRNIERKKSAYVKSQNRRLVNEILQHGNKIKTEKVSVKGWQKRYGKAISAKGPGFFQSELKRKAENVAALSACFLKSRRRAQRVSSQHFLLKKRRYPKLI